MTKQIERIVVPENEQQKWDEDAGEFIEQHPSNYFILNALGDKVYYKTRSREEAQREADLDWDGRYKIRTVKDAKGKSKQESGGLSVYGNTTRKCTGSWLKKS